MKALIEITLAVIFSIIVGTNGARIISANIKKEAIIKISGGLGSIEDFTKKLTNK